jgi:hypothetical protein
MRGRAVCGARDICDYQDARHSGRLAAEGPFENLDRDLATAEARLYGETVLLLFELAFCQTNCQSTNNTA